jgi:hypothetical protein
MQEVVTCPICGKRIFDLECQGKTDIKIKCIHCKRIISIIRNENKKANIIR